MSSATSAADLPDYAQLLERANHAQYSQLRRIAQFLGIAPGQRVLDVACGDGWYSRLFASLMRHQGQVVATDCSAAYLARARAKASLIPDDALEVVLTDGRQLPFSEGTFDVAWCAHSMITLNDRTAILREMGRVVKPGGVVAVLENDPLHAVILPWPLETELVLRTAELQAARRDSPSRVIDSNRQLARHFREAGLGTMLRESFVEEIVEPIPPLARAFLENYIHDLWERTQAYLDADVQRGVRKLVDPALSSYLLAQPGAAATLLETLYWARV